MEPPSPSSTNPLATPLLQPDEFKALARRIQLNANRFSITMTYSIYGGVVAIIVSCLVSFWVGGPSLATVGSIASILGLTFLCQWRKFNALKCDKEAERLIQFLANTQDVDMLGPILDLEDTYDGPGKIHDLIQTSMDAAVLRLLPLVQNSHSNALTWQHRRRIWFYEAAGTKWLPRLARLDRLPHIYALLQAMEQIGNKNDLYNLKRMARRAESSQELTAAIQYCIDVVEERVAREEGKDFLLRSGDNPDATATLLRPTIERADTPSDQLLRAAEGQVLPPRETPSSSDFQA